MIVWQERPRHKMLFNVPVIPGDRITLRDGEGELFNILFVTDREGRTYPGVTEEILVTK